MNGNSAVFAATKSLMDAWPELLVGCVLFSWVMVRLARRRQISGWPLAWIPVMNLWVMGNISDQYQYVVYGKERRSGFWLALLAGTMEFLLILGALGLRWSYGFVAALWATVLDVVTAVLIVRFYCCLYRLYCSCVPKRAVAYLVWSVCLPVLTVLFLLLCKDKEDGMPMRRDTLASLETAEPAEELPAFPEHGETAENTAPGEEKFLTAEETPTDELTQAPALEEVTDHE